MRKKFVNGIYRAIPMAALLVAIAAAQGQQMPSEYDQALKTLGKQGDFKSNVLKINIPRNDLKVIVDGVATPTPFGFGGWLAMTKGAHGDVMMGDLVLTQDEVNPVMSALLDHGLEVTAVHNHFFFEEPRIFYMHVMGHGTPAELAKMAKPAIDLIGNVPASHTATTAAASSAAEGAQIFQRVGCVACHSVDGTQAGKTGPTLKGVYGSTVQLTGKPARVADEAYVLQSILEPGSDIVKGFEPGMPSFRGVLSDAQVKSLVMYIQTLGKK